MVLQKQNIAVPFKSGVDTKHDPLQQQQGLTVLKNACFDAIGAINKRNGFTRMVDAIQGSPSGKTLSYTRDVISDGNRLLRIGLRRSTTTPWAVDDGLKLSQWNGPETGIATGDWKEIDWCHPAEVKILPVGKPLTGDICSYENCDIDYFTSATTDIDYMGAVSSGLARAASPYRKAYFSLFNVSNDNGTPIVGPQELYVSMAPSADLFGAKIFHHAGGLTVLNIADVKTSATLQVHNFLEASTPPWTYSGGTSLLTLKSALFDAVPSNDSTLVYIVYQLSTDTTHEFRIGIFNQASQTITSNALVHGTNALLHTLNISLCGDNLVCTWEESSNGIWYSVNNAATLAEVVAPTKISNIPSGTVIAGASACVLDPINTSPVTYCIYFDYVKTLTDYKSASYYKHTIYEYTVKSGSASSATAIRNNACMAARPWVASYKIFMLIKHQSTYSSSFVLTCNGTGTNYSHVVASTMRGYAGQRNGKVETGYTYYTLNKVVTTHPVFGAMVYSTGLLQQSKLLDDKNIINAPVSLILRCGYSGAFAPATSADTKDNIYIAHGGFLSEFDGALAEQNYLQDPDVLVWGDAAMTGGFLEDGESYSYMAVYEYRNKYNEIVRSTTSLELTVVPDKTGDVQTVTIFVPSLTIGNKDRITDTKIVLYRTKKLSSGDTTYYKLPMSLWVRGDTSSCYLSVTDGTADADLTDNEPLYTLSGELDAEPAPPTMICCRFMNRIVCVDSEKRNRLWYSKPKVDGVSVEFSGFLTLSLLTNEDITALCPLDDKLIVFTTQNIYVVYGEGLNALGVGSGYDYRMISSAAGCLGSTQLVSTEDGIFFKSRSGIMFLDRGLSVQPIGLPVAYWDSYTVRSAIYHKTVQQVWFSLYSQRTILVYDVLMKQWSQWTLSADGTMIPDQMCIYQEIPIFNSNAGYLNRYDSTAFVDTDAAARTIALVATTGWMQFDNIQGMERVYWIHLLGHLKSACTLNVKVYWDYSDTAAETLSLASSAASLIGDVLRCRFKPARQKGSAIKLEIYDSSCAGTCQGLELSNLGLTIGTKGKFQKLAGSNTI